MPTLQPIAIPALKDNYIWAIAHPKKKTCLIVDPGEAAPVQQFLKHHQLSLSHILITHHHQDHTGGLSELLDIHTPIITGSSHSPCPYINHPLKDQKHFTVPDLELEFSAIDIPGHTLCHTAFLAQDILFTGDTLFSAGCGRIFEGSVPMMYASLQKLSNLNPSTRLFCGHEYTVANLDFALTVEPNNQTAQQHQNWALGQIAAQRPTLPSTLSLECQINPFLRCSQPSVIQAAEQHADQTLPDPIAVFKTLRQWKDQF